jgi:MazG family protein
MPNLLFFITNKNFYMDKFIKMSSETANKFAELIQIMNRLRAECPWDKKQTAQSLRQYIIEEAHEVIETIDNKEWHYLKEELGDLLLQIVFQSKIAEENNHFKLSEVIDSINNKLVSRHPHVYGNKKVNTAKDVESNWEHIKLKEQNRSSVLSGIPKTTPALLQAQRLQEKASGVKFDWPEVSGVFDKLEEEIIELKKAIANKNNINIQEELGDLLFTIVNLTRFLGVVAEDALRSTNAKFIKRFSAIEAHFKYDYNKLKNASLAELDQIWNKAKEKDNHQNE